MANTIRLPKLPSLPSTPTSVTLTPCLCGCGEKVARSFAPGHDARLASFVKRVLRGSMTIAGIVSWHVEQGIEEDRSASIGAAVLREVKRRKLAHVKWDAEPEFSAAMLGTEPEQATGTDGQ